MALGDDLKKQTKNSVRNENRKRNSQKEKVKRKFCEFLQKEVSKFVDDLKKTLEYNATEGRRSAELTICSLPCPDGHFLYPWHDLGTRLDLANFESCFQKLQTFCQKEKLHLKLRKEPRLQSQGGYRRPFQYIDLKADISW